MNPAAPSSQGLWKPKALLGFLWGLAEGSLFFVIPDVLLSWAALADARCGLKTLISILGGSLVAGILMYGWADLQPEQSRAAVAAVPFVRGAMFAKVERDYHDHRLMGLLYGPSSGVPYKVYAVLAPPLHQPLLFILLTIPARLERLALSWLVFTGIGFVFKAWIAKHARTTFLIFINLWAVIYTAYWGAL